MLTSLVASTLLLAAPASSSERLEEVQVTATRRAQSTQAVASAVAVVGIDELERANLQVAVDALRGVPGVFVQQTTAGQGIPIVRGLKGSQVLHLVDGFRLNNAFFRNAPNQYFALVEASDIAQVEVLRGPVSTLYGSDALGGVVQLITKKPELDSALAWNAGLNLSSADLATISSVGATVGSDRNAIRAHLGYSDIGDRRTGSGDRLKPSGYRSESAGISWRHQFQDEAELLVHVDYLNQPSTPRVDELIPGFGEVEPASTAFFFEPNRRLATTASYNRSLDTSWADDLIVRGGWQRIDDDRRTQNFGSDSQRNELNRSDLFGLTAQLSRAWGSADLTYGFEYYADEIDSERRETDLATGQQEVVPARFPDGSTIDSSAWFANLNWDLSAETELTIGGRYSDFAIDLAQADRPANLDLDDVTFNISLQHSLTEQTNLIAGFGKGFRAPNIFDLGTLGARPGNRFNVANSGLGPETVFGSELGVKQQTDNYQLQAFAFYSDFEDKITSAPTGEFTADGRQIVQSINAASVALYGVEFGGRYLPTDDIELYAALNWIRGQEESETGSEQPADRIPPINGKIGLSTQLAPSWSLDLNSVFAARQDRLSDRDLRDNRINPNGTPGWVTLNAALQWQPKPGLDVGLAVENISDIRYREHGSGLDRPGRNVVLSVRFDRR